MKNIEIKNIPEVPSKIKRAVNDKKLAIFIIKPQQFQATI
jgi:hypothetical protein